MTTKRVIECKRCKKLKDKSAFMKSAKTTSGIIQTCLECARAMKRADYQKHRTKRLQTIARYTENNKEKINDYRRGYFSSKHGKIVQIIQNIKKRCENPFDKRFHRYGGRGIKNLLTYEDLDFLWERDKASTLEKPSLDRIDVNGDYTISNCQFIEMKLNSRKDFLKKVKQFDLSGNFVREWPGIVDAEKEGFQRSNIIKCCKKQRKTHKGFAWAY